MAASLIIKIWLKIHPPLTADAESYLSFDYLCTGHSKMARLVARQEAQGRNHMAKAYRDQVFLRIPQS
jgi:hypothetical protein